MAVHFRKLPRTSAAIRSSICLATLCSYGLHAQDVSSEQPKKTDTAAVSVEVFQGPQVKDVTIPVYPFNELTNGVEGWVNVGFMVDPKGKTYELTIESASGDNKRLNKAALDAVKKWTFEPATVNGEPVDSSLSRKIIFTITDKVNGANAQFVSAYKVFQKAINAKDKAGAETALEKMKVKNLYEDAYYGVAQYSYAALWDDADHQLLAITRAVAGEQTPKYLPKKIFLFALQEKLGLEIQTQDFANALFTWYVLQKAETDKAVLDKFRHAIDEVLKFRNSNQAYQVPGQLKDGSWNYILFRHKFRINVIEGRLSQIKLRCNKKYIFFQFDPTVEYRISEKYGTCGMELVGEANTKFDLIQI